jgi:hypothetical protein
MVHVFSKGLDVHLGTGHQMDGALQQAGKPTAKHGKSSAKHKVVGPRKQPAQQTGSQERQPWGMQDQSALPPMQGSGVGRKAMVHVMQ